MNSYHVDVQIEEIDGEWGWVVGQQHDEREDEVIAYGVASTRDEAIAAVREAIAEVF